MSVFLSTSHKDNDQLSKFAVGYGVSERIKEITICGIFQLSVLALLIHAWTVAYATITVALQLARAHLHILDHFANQVSGHAHLILVDSYNFNFNVATSILWLEIQFECYFILFAEMKNTMTQWRTPKQQCGWDERVMNRLAPCVWVGGNAAVRKLDWINDGSVLLSLEMPRYCDAMLHIVYTRSCQVCLRLRRVTRVLDSKL